MITRRQMLADAAGLVADADDQYRAIQLADPSRTVTTRVILCDAVRVHMLLSTRLPFRRIGREIWLVRIRREISLRMRARGFGFADIGRALQARPHDAVQFVSIDL